MINPTEFNSLVERAITESGKRHMRPVIEKELLHYDILFALDKEGLLDKITFQGGTSLRLCYGSSRFSEDLDFAGGKDFSSKDMHTIKSCLEDYISKRYNLAVSVKEPAQLKKEDPVYAELKINKWQISIVTAPQKRDIPKQKIKIEVANVPAYSHEARALEMNYDFLPDGYNDILIMTETLDEILTDKIVSLVNTHKYIRYRDIWDLRWLKQKGANFNVQWLRNKLNDYKVENFLDKLDLMRMQLPEIILSREFTNEIGRFIPIEAQDSTIKKDKFNMFLTSEIQTILNAAKTSLQQT